MAYRTSKPLHPTEFGDPDKKGTKGMTGSTGKTGYSIQQYKTDSVKLDKAIGVFKAVHEGKKLKEPKPGEVSNTMKYINARRAMYKIAHNKGFQNLSKKRNPK